MRSLAKIVCFLLLSATVSATASAPPRYSGSHYSSPRVSHPHSYTPKIYPSKAGNVTVDSYKTRRGTYVAAHHRTAADHTKINNFSTRGSANPYTDKPGYKRPY